MRVQALFAAGFVILIALPGCTGRAALYGDIAEQRSAAYRHWRQTEQRKSKSTLVIQGDLSLGRALRLALANNKEIRAAIEERARAEGLLRQAYAGALPSATATGAVNRLDRAPVVGFEEVSFPLALGEGSRNVWNTDLTLCQPLFRGGAILAGIRRGELTRILADEQVRSVVERVMLDLARTYYDSLLAKKLYAVNETALKSAQGQLDDVIKRKAAGVATTLDVYRAQVEVSNVRGEMIAQANRLRLGKAALLKLIGLSQQSDVRLVSDLAYRPISPVLEKAVQTAFARRPDLYMSEVNVRLQRESVAIAESRRFPFLEAFYRFTYNRPNPRNTADSTWGRSWRAGLNVTWSLFDGFRRQGEIAEQEARLRQSALHLADAQERALLELRQAFVRIRDAELLLDTQRLNVKRAREGLRLARAGYPEVTTLVEVNDALTAFVRAEGQYWTAVRDHAVARLELQKAMGLLAGPPGSTEAAAPPEPAVIPAFMGAPAGSGTAPPAKPADRNASP